MISKNQLKKILFIYNHAIENDLFLSDLLEKLDLYLNERLSTNDFNNWLNSWEAVADLDRDPASSERIKKAFKEIKSGKTPHKSWKDFKESLGLS